MLKSDGACNEVTVVNNSRSGTQCLGKMRVRVKQREVEKIPGLEDSEYDRPPRSKPL